MAVAELREYAENIQSSNHPVRAEPHLWRLMAASHLTKHCKLTNIIQELQNGSLISLKYMYDNIHMDLQIHLASVLSWKSQEG